MEFVPIISGITPDIKSDFDSTSSEGKIVFSTLDVICASVDQATSLKIRNDPYDLQEKEANGDQEELLKIKTLKEERLNVYQTNFKTWIQSLVPDTSTSDASLTFIRNVYPMNAEGLIGSTPIKAAWVTGLGVAAALDCGSGKVALVDGTTGAQIGGNQKWDTNLEDARWNEEDIEKYSTMLSNICIDAGRTWKKEEASIDGNENSKQEMTMAYGTGNWRKKHMRATVEPFRQALLKHGIDFNMLPGALEARYGGISSLKCAAPYDKENVEWTVIELGGGSTQISRFRKKK